MAAVILGLDIGGANLKAAAPDRRAASVPFALWKQPDKLPAALAEMVARFPDAEELAVTMTGELCDCFETKRDGVNAILAAVRFASGGRRIRVWSTGGAFVTADEAKANHLRVAAANWHALATLAGQYVPTGPAVLVDVGSTTTDVVPILDGRPVPKGLTDYERMFTRELLYTGVRRTPVCAVLGELVAAELFATTLDAYLTLGLLPEDPADRDTADGRPATRRYARARLARMYCGDSDTVPEEVTRSIAEAAYERQASAIRSSIEGALFRLADLSPAPQAPELRAALGSAPVRTLKYAMLLGEGSPAPVGVMAGAGEFLACRAVERSGVAEALSLADRLGPGVSACAPAYAVAVLAAESRS